MKTKIPKENIPIYIISALIFISLLDPLIPGARYIKYLIAPTCLIIIAHQGRIRIPNSPHLIPFYIYILAGAIYLAISPTTKLNEGAIDILFILTYITPFLIKRKPVSLEAYFLIASTIFLATTLPKLGSSFKIDIANSESTLEDGQFGFIFAIFSIYFLTQKKYRLATISIALTILTLKRIALLGMLISLLAFYTKNLWYYKRLYVAFAFGILNLAFLAATKFLISDEFNELTSELLGMSSNHLLMGRVTLYSRLFDNTSMHLLYGQGPGSLYNLLTSFGSTTKALIHSDLLKIATEFGLAFYFIFFFTLYLCPKKYIEYPIFLNVVMASDNLIIYAGVMFFFLLAIESTNTPSSSRKNENTTHAQLL